MSDIFLCYSRTDSEIAGTLERHLSAEGWSVYRDVRTQIGRRWHAEIERELHAARAVLVLWSEKSRDSDYVLEEAQYGKDQGILFPAFIEPVEYPYGFRRIQTADLIGWSGEASHAGLAQLLDALHAHLGPDATAPGKTAEPPSPAAASSPRNRFAPGQTFRDRLVDGGEGPLMVVIPPGRFLMGSPSSEPELRDNEGQHEVTIAKAFALGVYAVTFDDYDRFCRTENRELPNDLGWGRGQQPVINVSWHDAVAYCDWLARQTGKHYRLPSEAEWEYACRAGTTTPFHFGERLATSQANFNGNATYNGSAKGEYRERTMPVGSFPANAFGLHDMHGNVWEWCLDRWHVSYDGAPNDGSAWETGKSESRVLRGGSWGDLPWFCRAACREYSGPGGRDLNVGFRVCCVAPID